MVGDEFWHQPWAYTCVHAHANIYTYTIRTHYIQCENGKRKGKNAHPQEKLNGLLEEWGEEGYHLQERDLPSLGLASCEFCSLSYSPNLVTAAEFSLEEPEPSEPFHRTDTIGLLWFSQHLVSCHLFFIRTLSVDACQSFSGMLSTFSGI